MTMAIKTSRARFAALRGAIQSLHSYETPEIVALPIVEGSEAYMKWLGEQVQ